VVMLMFLRRVLLLLLVRPACSALGVAGADVGSDALLHCINKGYVDAAIARELHTPVRSEQLKWVCSSCDQCT
jgi:hypothetical protein